MTHSIDFDEIDRNYESGVFGPHAHQSLEYFWSSPLGALMIYRDVEGRPLAEEIAPKAARENVPWEFKTCHYNDSRRAHAKPMNVSSLQQFKDHWTAVLREVGIMRERYMAERGPSSACNPVDLWIITRLGLLLPAFMVRVAKAPLGDGEIPTHIAIIYRMGLGLNHVSYLCLLETLTLGQPIDADSRDADALYQVADERGLFEGAYSVCAGPPKLIVQAFDSLLQPPAQPHSGEHYVKDAFLAYAYLENGLDLEKYIFAIEGTILVYDLARAWRVTEEQEQPLVVALLEFDAWAALNLSTLAHEIAREDRAMLTGLDTAALAALPPEPFGAIRTRIIDGLIRLRRECAVRYHSLGREDPLAMIARSEMIAFCGEPVDEVYSLLGANGGDDSLEYKLVTRLVSYLQLECRFMDRTEWCQTRLCLDLGHPDPNFTLNADAISRTFGPRLRDFAAQQLGINIETTATGATLTSGDRKLCLRLDAAQ